MAWIEPVVNRTGGEQYTHNDLNRVGADVKYLSDLLHSFGYAVTTAPKTTWTVGEKQRNAAMVQYLADVTALKAAFYGGVTLPTTMDALTAAQANAIEQQLVQIETNLNHMLLSFLYCGEALCGEV